MEEPTEEVVVESSPLALDMDPAELNRLIDQKISEYRKYVTDIRLDDRSKDNVRFWKGDQQFKDKKLRAYQIPYMDNKIWEDEETRIAIASSRLPDIVVTPDGKDQDAYDRAKAVEQALDMKINTESTKLLVKDSLRNRDLYYRACIKVVKSDDGEDFRYEVVDPETMILDASARIPHDGLTADNFEFISHYVEEPTEVMLAKFPKKADELRQQFGKSMPSKVKYLEIHYTAYQNGAPIEAVCWRYKRLILNNIKTPNYDYEGTGKVDATGSVAQQEPHNFFDRPKKPFIFVPYQNLGKGPIDDTSPIEQSIPLQRHINKGGRQVTELADRAAPKLAFAGMTDEQIREITNDPEEHINLGKNTEDARTGIVPIPGTPPDPTLYQNLAMNRAQVDSKFATHKTTRGEGTGDESGVARQITREGDLTMSDDIATTSVQRMIGEMAEWGAQMMSILFKDPKEMSRKGQDGEVTGTAVHRYMVRPSMGISVRASSTDKTTRRNDALQLAASASIDPLSLFEAMDMPNPKEKTKRLISYLVGAQDGYARYMQSIGISFDDPAAATDNGGELGAQEAMNDIALLQSGEQPQLAGTPGHDYVSVFEQFIQSPEFDGLDPQIKANVQAFIQQLKAAIPQETNQPVTTPNAPSQIPGQGVPAQQAA